MFLALAMLAVTLYPAISPGKTFIALARTGIGLEYKLCSGEAIVLNASVVPVKTSGVSLPYVDIYVSIKTMKACRPVRIEASSGIGGCTIRVASFYPFVDTRIGANNTLRVLVKNVPLGLTVLVRLTCSNGREVSLALKPYLKIAENRTESTSSSAPIVHGSKHILGNASYTSLIPVYVKEETGYTNSGREEDEALQVMLAAYYTLLAVALVLAAYYYYLSRRAATGPS